jgi:hypothetical protein
MAGSCFTYISMRGEGGGGGQNMGAFLGTVTIVLGPSSGRLVHVVIQPSVVTIGDVDVYVRAYV